MGKSSNPPPPPGLSQEERNLLSTQKELLDQARGLIGEEAAVSKEDRNLLRTLSGLYGSTGELDPNAVADLRSRLLSQQKQSEEIGNLFAQRQQQALTGQAPLSAQQIQSEREAFGTLKAAAAQRGIRIDGSDLFTASSDSTAGNQMLSELRRNAEQQRERRINDVIYGPSQGPTQNLGLGLLGQAQQSGPGGAAPAYLGLGQQYGAAAQPFQQQRYLNYQYQIQKAANRRNPLGGILGGAVGGATAGGAIGGPWGAGIGAVLGGLGGGYS